jgi:hypothetical protein
MTLGNDRYQPRQVGWPGASFLNRRMRSAGLLLAGVAIAAFVAASAASVLVTFASQVLPLGAAGQLSRLPGMWLGAIGLTDAGTAAADTAAIRGRALGDLGDVPFRLYSAIWSAPLRLTTAAGRAVGGAEVATAPQITANATLTSGSWPAPPAGPAGAPGAAPVQVAVPVTVARELGVTTGDVLSGSNSNTGARLRIAVSGIYRQDNAAAPYWNLDAIWTCSARAQGCFTAGGPVVANPAAVGRSGALGVDQASWVLVPDAARISSDALAATAARISATASYLQTDQALGGLVVSGDIPQDLTSVAAELTASRVRLAITALLLLVPAAGALALAARLLAAHREEEHALLLARGATRATLTAPVLAEAMLTGGLAALTGILAGPRAAALLAGPAPAGAGSPGAVNALAFVPADWWAALVVVALCTVTLSWPLLRSRLPAVLRARRGRQAVLAGVAVAGGDLALLALAGIGAWQLHGYTPVPGASVNPVVAAAPALVLAAASLVPMRLQPLLARALDRGAAVTAGVTGAMGAWEISRLQVRRSAPVLLTVLAVATGTLALASYASWQKSANDQAAFTAGADIRVDTPWPVTAAQFAAMRHAPGVTAAMRAAFVPLSTGTLLAVDARAAPDAVLLRADLSPLPEAALFRALASGSRPVPAVATAAFLQAGSLKVGMVYPVTIGGGAVPVRIVAAVSAFPQLPAGAGGGILADLDAVDRVLAGQRRSPLPVTSVWLRDGTAVAPALPAHGQPLPGLPVPEGSVVTSRGAVTSGLLGDSLSAAPQRATLAVAVAVTLLAAFGFAAAAAATLRERRSRRMVLKALGVPLTSQTRQLCGEELLLSVPAAIAGLLAGIGLSHLLVSVLVLTPGGAAPVPPVTVVVPLGWAAVAAAVICALPPLVALAAAAQRSDAAAALRGAEAT